MKTTKTIALLLAVLMLLCTVGCNDNIKSIEMTCENSVLENGYFTMKVNGYNMVQLGTEQTGDSQTLAYLTDTEEGKKVRIAVTYYPGTQTLPTKEYFSMRAASFFDATIMEKGELSGYEEFTHGDISGVRLDYILTMTDGSIRYAHREIVNAGERYSFTVSFYDYTDGTDAPDALYTTAIDSFKLK